jgi:hypothetical protein
MTTGRDPSFRDGMPWWAWWMLALGRVMALVPVVLAIALVVWLARGGIHEVPGLFRAFWAGVVAFFDSLGGRG